jgi:3-oxoacyl-[acyl-carrier-protein] synthase II
MSGTRDIRRRRVVITGLGIICPLGITPAALWSALTAGRSGVAATTLLPADQQPLKFAGEARQFSGEIDDFGQLDKEQKKAIKKGLKVMCRETRMAVAAAQLALSDAGFGATLPPDPEKSGVVLGSDYMLTVPEDFETSIPQCVVEGSFRFDRWGHEGLGQMAPLWMLKYLPNMPASHIAIFNDLRGPNNSLTMREASSNLAVGEAFQTIQRGHATLMVAGATGTRVLPMQALHAMQSEQMAADNGDPAKASRPFDWHRTGMVCGEGAGMIVLEELSAARARGARIYAEVRGLGRASVASSLSIRERAGVRAVSSQRDPHPNPLPEGEGIRSVLRGRCHEALAIAMRAALKDAGATPADVGHINAHGLSTTDSDVNEARAIGQVFGPLAGRVPVTAPKSYFGNLGAGSGVVELAASVLALGEGRLPRVLNYETPDPDCPLAVVRDDTTPAGRSFLKLSVTPQGQAAVLYVEAVE